MAISGTRVPRHNNHPVQYGQVGVTQGRVLHRVSTPYTIHNELRRIHKLDEDGTVQLDKVINNGPVYKTQGTGCPA